MAIPERLPALQSLDQKWAPRWERDNTYAFDRSARREDVFSIDSPPLTASGTLHLGHVFSYTHTDLTARFRRMRGSAVFYPVAFDDNGLPTERRVERHFGVRCDPTSPDGPGRVSRDAFLQLCARLTADDEAAYERIWRRLGLSVDWTLSYRTLGERAIRISQQAFLRDLARGDAYRAEAPTLWDTTYRTAVAQAETVDREIEGAYHRLRFASPAGDVLVDTTRPELLPACVALVAHPDDDRYRELFGGTVRTPLFTVDIPVHAHDLADPGQGTGIAMVCTFGDSTDIVWWRDLNLPVRPVLGFDGRFRAEPPSDVDREAYGLVAGQDPETARAGVVTALRNCGALVGEPRPIRHMVKFYEKGESPLEIVSGLQWYIRNGGRDPQLRKEMLALGTQIDWHPERMRIRYDNWVRGLRGDWLISRQRFLGVPIPVWYAMDDGAVLIPDRLPVDPATATPPGYRAEQRNQPGGFTAETDVMDTWATSSLSPLIAADGMTDRVLPMDLRPQAHEIIRTWLFCTLLRQHLAGGQPPWRHAVISGWAVDSAHQKMGKSTGNAASPEQMLDQFGPDALRYWAARGRPGTDTAFDPAQVKVGRRLATKLLNASRFVLSFGESTAEPDQPLDRALLAALSQAVSDATEAFCAYDHTRALERIEQFFWRFCDDYIELVKERAYQGCPSAIRTLRLALSALQRMLAPFLPFVTEEVWSWWQDGSVHRAGWPTDEYSGEAELFDVTSTVLSGLRQAKSARGLAMRTPVRAILVSAPEIAQSAASELRQAAHADRLELTPADAATVRIET